MANKTKITSWILKNRADLNPGFTEFSWPTRYFRGLHDFQARIEWGGIVAYGRGVDTDKDLALEKASAEAIERLICLTLNFPSEGMAVSGEHGADDHARREALERYYFNQHIVCDIPFVKTNAASVTILTDLFLKQNPNAFISFYRMATPANLNGIVCCISTKSMTPQFLGLALDPDPARAALRSMNEALANYARMMDSPNTFLAEVEASEDCWACKPSYLETIYHLFSDNSNSTRPIPVPNLVVGYIDTSSIKVLKGCPIMPRLCQAIKGIQNDKTA